MRGKRKIVKTAIFLTMVALLVTFGIFVFAQRNDSSNATVLKVEGFADLKVKGTGKTVTLVEGMKVGVGDVITTDSESSVEFKLRDGSVLKIGSDSIIVIKELGQVEVTKVSRSKFELIQGKVRAVVNPLLNKESKFTIETENATIGVRGTDFGVLFDIDLGETYIISIEDCVSVVAKNFPSLDPIDVCTMKGLLVSGGDVPGGVIGVDKEKLKEFLEEMGITEEMITDLEDILPPEITSAFFNNRIDLENLEGTLTLTKDDLSFDGKILLGGTAEDEKYIITKIEVSKDGGMTWGGASGTDRWTFSFKPEVGIEYEVMIRAINEMGIISDPEDFGEFLFTFVDVSYVDIAKTFIDNFISYIKSNDTTGLGDLISDIYDGKAGGLFGKDELLDDSLEAFFDLGLSMTISYTINQVSFDGTSIVISTSWTASIGGETNRGTTKWWLSQSDNYLLVHTEGSWFITLTEPPADPEMTVEVVASGIPLCPGAVEIMMVAPDIPKSIMIVTVNSDTICNSSRSLVLTRAYYTAKTERIDGFGGVFIVSDRNPCGMPGVCDPLLPIIYNSVGDPSRYLNVTYSGFGYNFNESVYLP